MGPPGGGALWLRLTHTERGLIEVERRGIWCPGEDYAAGLWMWGIRPEWRAGYGDGGQYDLQRELSLRNKKRR